MEFKIGAHRGVYTADRAAALSGVPRRTVYEWAESGIVEPSVSAERVMLWSWSDLVALRAVYWLRHPATGGRRRASMRKVKSVLSEIRCLAGDPGGALADGILELFVDTGGTPHIASVRGLAEAGHDWQQAVARDLVIDLLAPFQGEVRGPHLLQPRPSLRIVPGKLSGEPHIRGTRVETRVLWALKRRGFDADQIISLYPELGRDAVQEAISFEEELANAPAAA